MFLTYSLAFDLVDRVKFLNNSFYVLSPSLLSISEPLFIWYNIQPISDVVNFKIDVIESCGSEPCSSESHCCAENVNCNNAFSHGFLINLESWDSSP